MRVVCFKVTRTLHDLIERTWRELGYASKSELIRDAVIWFIAQRYHTRGGVRDAEGGGEVR